MGDWYDEGYGYPTPPAAPNVGSGILGAATTGGLIGAAGQLAGSILNSKAQGNQLSEQKHEFDVTQQRKNQLLRLALPGLLGNLGYSAASIPEFMSNPSLSPQVLGAPR
jgi:hypothetical protein